MHFEILVEDQSGKKALDVLVPKIICGSHTYRILPYKGLGKLPSNFKSINNPSNYLLLNQLPQLLRNYGRAYARDPSSYPAVVILVCDLDNKNLQTFRQELLSVLDHCRPPPKTRFCIAIEEGEAWFFGDIPAIKAAYPKAKNNVLNRYKNDSICGTWERLADAVYPGRSAGLSKKGWQAVGKEKSEWAENITPHMDVEKNKSPSFCYFRNIMRKLAQTCDGHIT